MLTPTLILYLSRRLSRPVLSLSHFGTHCMQHNTRPKPSGDASARSAGQNSGSGHCAQPQARVDEPAAPSPQQKLHADSLQVLMLLNNLRITIGTLNHAIFYGNPESCANLTMQEAQRPLVEEMLQTLDATPSSPLRRLQCDVFGEELLSFSESYAVPQEDLAKPEELAKVDTLYVDMRSSFNYLYKTLLVLTRDDEVPEEEEGGTGELEEALDGYKSC
ncbi:hypothetical protein BDV93DRAFT_508350 [Ceratobasidium sp. AG-I]|nr:hypothetical protein BDV93DRAFT_508350 [Ceratobasidium sp. AG-I]